MSSLETTTELHLTLNQILETVYSEENDSVWPEERLPLFEDILFENDKDKDI